MGFGSSEQPRPDVGLVIWPSPQVQERERLLPGSCENWPRTARQSAPLPRQFWPFCGCQLRAVKKRTNEPPEPGTCGDLRYGARTVINSGEREIGSSAVSDQRRRDEGRECTGSRSTRGSVPRSSRGSARDVRRQTAAHAPSAERRGSEGAGALLAPRGERRGRGHRGIQRARRTGDEPG